MSQIEPIQTDTTNETYINVTVGFYGARDDNNHVASSANCAKIAAQKVGKMVLLHVTVSMTNGEAIVNGPIFAPQAIPKGFRPDSDITQPAWVVNEGAVSIGYIQVDVDGSILWYPGRDLYGFTEGGVCRILDDLTIAYSTSLS